MENRLEVQNIQGDELFMDLTPEELKELEQVKGGSGDKPLTNGITAPSRLFPLGIVEPFPNTITAPSKPFPLEIVKPFPNGIPAPFPNVISKPSILTN